MPSEESDHELLIRIDERTQAIQAELKQYAKRSELESVKTALSETVQQAEFRPVRAIVYGGVGVILTAVAAAIVGVVIQR